MTRPPKILLVEDNPADIELTRESFEMSQIDHELAVAEDGQEALDYLFGNGEWSEPNKVDIILLDINLPKVNGHEVLRQVKTTPLTQTIPIIMLTSSADGKDIDQSYRDYCSGYICKPVDIDSFMNIAGKVETFWFNLVTLPDEPAE